MPVRSVAWAAAERFGWPRFEKANGRGRGFAFARYKNRGAYAAVPLEVAVDRESGRIDVLRAVCAVDSGDAVNPDGIRNQMITRPGSPFLGTGEAAQGPTAAGARECGRGRDRCPLSRPAADATARRRSLRRLRSPRSPPAFDVRAAAAAGVVAGVVATIAQVALWALLTDALPAILYRDARFAAAVVLGRHVLPPPATIDLAVMLAATLVHFAVAIGWTLVLAVALARLPARFALAVGAAFGIAVYAIDLYGFTALFPWFAASRDAIAAAAHVVFGIAAAVSYVALARKRG